MNLSSQLYITPTEIYVDPLGSQIWSTSSFPDNPARKERLILLSDQSQKDWECTLPRPSRVSATGSPHHYRKRDYQFSYLVKNHQVR